MYPKLPRLERGRKKTAFADGRVLLVLNRTEMTEVLACAQSRGKASQPVFLEPVFCEDIAELQTRLDALMPLHRRTVITLEITAVAQAVPPYWRPHPSFRGTAAAPDLV